MKKKFVADAKTLEQEEHLELFHTMLKSGSLCASELKAINIAIKNNGIIARSHLLKLYKANTASYVIESLICKKILRNFLTEDSKIYLLTGYTPYLLKPKAKK